MFMFPRRSSKRPSGARGLRAYAVGDVHGRLDLLEQLLAMIHADIESRGRRETLLVFVGDLIDRGPNSAEVVERLRSYRQEGVRPIFLLGNHEEVLLRILDGETSLIPSWLRFGGAECLRSNGADQEEISAIADAEALGAIRKTIPDAHQQFLRGFDDTLRFGDYLFVHAGIRPGIELDQQRQSDLRWIREPFLLDETDHGFVVVHGHTICRAVEERPNRIGIDTGAYATGVLTAIGIEGTRRWFLATAAHAETAVPATH